MLAPFELIVPQSLDDAVKALLKYKKDVRIFAGGTDVFVEMHTDFESAKYLMDVKQIPELNVMKKQRGGYFIGANTPHHTLDRDPDIRDRFTALSLGSSKVGSVQIRHRGTVGGNVCTAAPSGDTLSPLLVLGAKAVIYGPKGQRKVPLEEFFTGPKRTALEAGELLVGLELPKPWEHQGSSYIKFSRRNAMDLALLGAAACIDLEDGVCRDVRVALTTSAPTPMRAVKTEEYLKGKKLTKTVLKKAGEIASEEARPRTSWRCTEEYRRQVIGVIVPQVISQAADEAKRKEAKA